MAHSVLFRDLKHIRDGFQFEARCQCGWRRVYMCSEGSPMDLVMATAQRDHDDPTLPWVDPAAQASTI